MPLKVYVERKLFLSTVRFEHGTFKSECQWTTNHRKIKEIAASLALLATPMQHK
jgi:hypothetical protein